MIHIEIESLAFGVLVSVSGDVDLATGNQLRAALAEAGGEHPGPVVVDLRGMSFLDVIGLKHLVAFQRRMRLQDRRMVVVAGDPVRRVLSLVPEADRFAVHAGPASAWVEAIEGW